MIDAFKILYLFGSIYLYVFFPFFFFFLLQINPLPSIEFVVQPLLLLYPLSKLIPFVVSIDQDRFLQINQTAIIHTTLPSSSYLHKDNFSSLTSSSTYNTREYI